MSRHILGSPARRGLGAALAVAAAAVLAAACSNAPVILAPAERPLSQESLMLLGKKGMDPNAPIFVRIFKEESELEVWKARDDGVFFHYKTYPICHWSGDLGPKMKQGDKQAPEGFYNVSRGQMNPHSQFYLAFNLGYPNAFDRAHKRDGNFLMVHGKCKSAGCYAMTDTLMEEIYALARESFKGGQTSFPVHAYPFRMTDANMERHKGNQWIGFWRTLKEAYDHFEVYRVPPAVAVCERRYVVNAVLPDGGRVDAEARCPTFERPQLMAFTPKPAEKQLAQERIVMPGPKTRMAAGALQADTSSPTETASTAGSSGLGLGSVGRFLGFGSGAAATNAQTSNAKVGYTAR